MRHLKSGSCKAVKEIVGARELNPGEVELGIVEQPRDAQFSRLDVTAD